MEEDEREVRGNDAPHPDQPVASYGLLYITRAYNRKEITFEEWLEQSQAWAEQIIRQHRKRDN